MNKIIITGRLTKDPELRTNGAGKPVCSFTLAVDRPFLNGKGERDADFIPVVVWGKSAEMIANSCRKSHRILIEGRLQIRNFEAKDGTKHWVAEVITSFFEFLETKDKAGLPHNSNKEIPDYGKYMGDLSEAPLDSPW